MWRAYSLTSRSARRRATWLIEHTHTLKDGLAVETCRMDGASERLEARVPGDALTRKRLIKAAKTRLYNLLKGLIKYKPKWGSLTGHSPDAPVLRGAGAGKAERGSGAAVAGIGLDVSPDKPAQLLREIVRTQRAVPPPARDEFHLYVGIPFCPTRCEYCAFPAEAVGRGDLIEPYLAALMREIERSALLMARQGPKQAAGYVGGGTPTSLSAMQLDRLLTALRWHFPGALEWTVEVGALTPSLYEKAAGVAQPGDRSDLASTSDVLRRYAGADRPCAHRQTDF